MSDDNPATNPVEQELRSLQPRELSVEFVERLGQRLSEQQSSVVDDEHNFAHMPFRIWRVATGLAAAVILALTVWFAVPTDGPHLADLESRTHGDSDTTLPETDNIAPMEMDETLPTVGNYRSVLRESPEALDALLQKHADTLLPPTRNLSRAELIKEASS